MEKIQSQIVPYAVIDIGSTSIRMIIAQVYPDGTLKTLEFLHQSVTLGKDTFTKGYITHEGIEECVKTLKSFRQVLDDYQIQYDKHLRAIATTAVREAANCDAFIDRIAIATGITIVIIDDSDIARLTYLSLHAQQAVHRSLLDENVVISEVSGGSSFLLYLKKGDVQFARSIRLGTLRTYEMLESAGTPDILHGMVAKSHIQRTISRIIDKSFIKETDYLIALGGDIKFAASHLLSSYKADALAPLRVLKLIKFTDTILSLSVDKCMKKYKLSYTDAEAIGPALLFYVTLAKALKLKRIFISPVSMRHGILLEMAGRGGWLEPLEDQIIRSVLATGRKYSFDEAHATHTAHLSSTLYKELQKEHGLDHWSAILLIVAAYLHDIGLFINTSGHHKHSMYLIQNSNLFGLNRKDLLLASLIARYHRRATPKLTHIGFDTLNRPDRLLVTKLAAILRIADALDRANIQQIKKLTCTCENERCVITVDTSADITLEQIALQSKGLLFKEVYGMEVSLRKAR